MAYQGKMAPGNEDPLVRFLGWFSIGLGLTQVLAPGWVASVAGVPKRRGLMRLMGFRELSAGWGIFTQPHPSGALWSRVVGDVIDLASLGGAMASPRAKKGRLTFATASVLGVSMLDLACARRLSDPARNRVVRVQSVTINSSPEKLYNYWRNFENLTNLMPYLESVRVINDKRSHWVANVPINQRIEWDSEVTDDIPGQLIAWRSLRGSDVDNAGSIRFLAAPAGRGCEVHIKLEYSPPAGQIGVALAKLFGKEPGQQIEATLRHFKQVMETGEVVNSDSSIHRGPYPAQPPSGRVEDITQPETQRRAA